MWFKICWKYCGCARWASTKKACLDKNSINTGLYRHFRDGCPGDTGARDLSHLRWTLLDHLDTNTEKLDRAGHQGGAKCRCSECTKLKNCEDKWICRFLLCSSISSSCHHIFLYKYANNSNSILFWSENLISPPYWI